MRDYITLGPTPHGETCLGVGDHNYELLARKECQRYKKLLESIFPDYADKECKFVIKSFPHDFGSYLEVCVTYNSESNESVNFAMAVDARCPETWEG